MPDDHKPTGKKYDYATRLSHGGRAGTHVHGFVNLPVHRGSTVLMPTVADRDAAGDKKFEQYLSYGATGNPTLFPLETMIAEIEGGTRCQLYGTGLAAITMPLLAYLKSGDHLLMPDSVYGPSRRFANTTLASFGVTTTYFDPNISATDLQALFQPNTRVLFLESPGSHTFEVQDVPALAATARASGIKVLMDNTWGLHHFQPFQHGVDVSLQALTKYAGGHSDVMMGSATTNSDEDWQIVRMAALVLGQTANPDEAWLCLRGLRTLAVRMDHQQKSALKVAEFLAQQPEVKQVLYPALPGAPGHALWKRDFTGAASLFGIELQPGFSTEKAYAFANKLELFGIGASWGGFESLVVPTSGEITRNRPHSSFAGELVRLHVGLESADDLIADLRQGLDVMHSNTIGAAAD